MRTSRLRLVALGLVVAGALVACGGDRDQKVSAGKEVSEGEPMFSRSDADTAIDVTLRDFVFDGLPSEIEGGKVFITATNAGSSSHEFEILDAAGETVDEIGAFSPGGSETLAVELKPGKYIVQCLVLAGDQRHNELGMTTELMVR